MEGTYRQRLKLTQRKKLNASKFLQSFSNSFNQTGRAKVVTINQEAPGKQIAILKPGDSVAAASPAAPPGPAAPPVAPPGPAAAKPATPAAAATPPAAAAPAAPAAAKPAAPAAAAPAAPAAAAKAGSAAPAPEAKAKAKAEAEKSDTKSLTGTVGSASAPASALPVSTAAALAAGAAGNMPDPDDVSQAHIYDDEDPQLSSTSYMDGFNMKFSSSVGTIKDKFRPTPKGPPVKVADINIDKQISSLKPFKKKQFWNSENFTLNAIYNGLKRLITCDVNGLRDIYLNIFAGYKKKRFWVSLLLILAFWSYNILLYRTILVRREGSSPLMFSSWLDFFQTIGFKDDHVIHLRSREGIIPKMNAFLSGIREMELPILAFVILFIALTSLTTSTNMIICILLKQLFLVGYYYFPILAGFFDNQFDPSSYRSHIWYPAFGTFLVFLFAGIFHRTLGGIS